MGDIVAGLGIMDVPPTGEELEVVLAKASAVLLSAKACREHLRTTLKNVNASRRFQGLA